MLRLLQMCYLIQIKQASPVRRSVRFRTFPGKRLCAFEHTALFSGRKVRRMETVLGRAADLPLHAIRIAAQNPVYPELARSSLLVGSLRPDGVLELVSAGWSRALGCPMSGLVGKRLAGFIHRADLHKAMDLFQGGSGAMIGKPVSFALIGRDGVRRCYDWYARKDHYDEVLFIVGTEKSFASGYPANVRSLRYSAEITP